MSAYIMGDQEINEIVSYFIHTRHTKRKTSAASTPNMAKTNHQPMFSSTARQRTSDQLATSSEHWTVTSTKPVKRATGTSH